MTEFEGLYRGGRDPTIQPLTHVIETLTGQIAPTETTEAVGGIEGAELTDARPINHERPKPAHWDTLVAFASELPIYKNVDGDTAYYEDASVDALRARMETLLDDEALDEHRYYSIGILLCGLARNLQDAEGRRKAATAVGSALFEHWSLYSQLSRGPLVSEAISGPAASRTFIGEIRDHAESLPPHVRLLGDVLTWHVTERELAIKQGKLSNTLIHISKKEGADGGNHYIAGGSVSEIGRITAIATTRVLRTVLKLRGEYLKNTVPGFPENPSAQQVIDYTDMDDINLIPVAQRAAAIRLDEMTNLEDTYLGLDGDGRAVFHGKKLPRSKDLPLRDASSIITMPLHTRRLRCPAIFVEGLIPNMLSCLIGAIKVADTLVQNEMADWLQHDMN